MSKILFHDFLIGNYTPYGNKDVYKPQPVYDDDCDAVLTDTIVIPDTSITINYHTPVGKNIIVEHSTDNPAGFSKKELAQQIMCECHKIEYDTLSVVENPIEDCYDLCHSWKLVSLEYRNGSYYTDIDT